MRVVINRSDGGFMLSEQAVLWLKEKGVSEQQIDDFSGYNELDRSHPMLVECIKTLGEAANGFNSRLRVVDVPLEIDDWYIMNYDGWERVVEVHREWDGEYDGM